MRISDHGNGITRDSLAFYRDNRHRLGEAHEVSVRFPGYDDPHDPYLLVLRDGEGNELRLSGCTTGYVGEGPNGTMRVLLDEGCPVVQAIVVLSAATAKFVRNDEGWAVADYTLANARPSEPASIEFAHDLLPNAASGSRPC